MLRQFGCAYCVLIGTWHFDASPAEDLVYVCVLVHAVPVAVFPVEYKRGQSAAGVQYSCRLAGLGPLELTGAPTEIRTQDLADLESAVLAIKLWEHNIGCGDRIRTCISKLMRLVGNRCHHPAICTP